MASGVILIIGRADVIASQSAVQLIEKLGEVADVVVIGEQSSPQRNNLLGALDKIDFSRIMKDLAEGHKLLRLKSDVPILKPKSAKTAPRLAKVRIRHERKYVIPRPRRGRRKS
ncbi:MAG: hypothetical protein G01um101491_61 [Parcubacteria group bacterium Gr01-1014_91]|nr:MAG: hypothetical protein G01um101491_61 [Parcubacteria group bacterium Gr01-1014_91]